MGAFSRFWNANCLMIGLVCTVLTIAVAAVLNDGQLASVFGVVAGMAFMWLGKPQHVEEDEAEAEA